MSRVTAECRRDGRGGGAAQPTRCFASANLPSCSALSARYASLGPVVLVQASDVAEGARFTKLGGWAALAELPADAAPRLVLVPSWDEPGPQVFELEHEGLENRRSLRRRVFEHRPAAGSSGRGRLRRSRLPVALEPWRENSSRRAGVRVSQRRSRRGSRRRLRPTVCLRRRAVLLGSRRLAGTNPGHGVRTHHRRDARRPARGADVCGHRLCRRRRSLASRRSERAGARWLRRAGWYDLGDRCGRHVAGEVRRHCRHELPAEPALGGRGSAATACAGSCIDEQGEAFLQLALSDDELAWCRPDHGFAVAARAVSRIECSAPFLLAITDNALLSVFGPVGCFID